MRLSTARFTRRAALCSLASGVLLAAGEFYAFDNATGRDLKLPLDEQAELLRQTGYAGMGLYTGTARLAEMTAALDQRGLRLLAVYVHAFVDAGGPRIDPGIPEAIRALRGRDTMLMLTLRGKAPDDDAAAAIVREVADLARLAGLRVCLYPHIGFFVETAADGVRVLRRAGRSNVGVAFNLPHELNYRLRAGQTPEWDAILKPVREHVWLASINGIGQGRGVETTIVRLDRSTQDVTPFLAALDRAGYRGPVSLQAVGVAGGAAENLRAAMAEWRRLQAEVARQGTP